MAHSVISLRRNILSAIGVTADNGGFWPMMVCPLLTRSGHWLCTATMVLMLVSAPIKVLA